RLANADPGAVAAHRPGRLLAEALRAQRSEVSAGERRLGALEPVRGEATGDGIRGVAGAAGAVCHAGTAGRADIQTHRRSFALLRQCSRTRRHSKALSRGRNRPDHGPADIEERLERAAWPRDYRF